MRKKKSNLQKKKDNPASTYWKTKSDKLWGLIIHAVYDSCAVNDGCAGNLEAHHLISRSCTMTRHAISNGILLCSKHHKFSQHLSAHMAPMAFAEWLQENDPDRYDWCSRNKWKTGKPDYEKAYGRLLEYCTENNIDV